MKKNLFLFLFSLIFSCSKPESETHEGFDIAIDTVFVDTGDDFIFLQGGLSHLDLTNDQKQLLNFSPRNELEVIDLDSLTLVQKIAMDREGPLGAGQPYAIEIDPTGRLILYGFNEVRVFSPDIDLMKQFRLSEDALSGLAPEMLAIFNPKLADGEFLYAIYENQEQVPQGLAIVFLEDMIVKKIPLDLASRIEPFTYSLIVHGNVSTKGYDPINLEMVDNNLIISTGYANEAFVLDLETEEVTIMNFHSELTLDKKLIPTKTAAETINEMQDFRREGQKSVSFGRFYFDKTQRRVWRFSEDLDREIGDSLVFKSVLTIFDDDLNQLAESVVPIDPFLNKFFKDGKLWSYVNVDDELGFAVFDFKF